MNKKYQGIVTACMGDSLVGYAVPLAYTYEAHWVRIVELETGMKMINKGVGGETSTQNLARFSDDIPPLSPKYCTIMTGGNDIYTYTTGGGTTVDTSIYTKCVDNIGKMVDMCRENNIIPIVATEPIGYYAFGDNQTQARFDIETTMIEGMRQAILAYCKENSVLFLDLCETSVYTDRSCRFIYNVHPNNKGNAIIAAAWIEFFDALIPDIEPELDAPENYGKKTLTLAYQWSGAEESKRYVEPAGKFASQTVESNALTAKAASATAAGVAWRGKAAVLYDSTSNEITASLTAKAANTTTAGIAWRGTGGGAATVASWALDGISVADGVLSLIGDDAQAELDAINGEVI